MTTFEQHQFSLSDGRHLSYLAAGPDTGRLVIFCHGWPAIGITWKPQLTAYAALGFRVIAPDMPGYGSSSTTTTIEDYSLEAVNAAMLALLDHCKQPSAIWVGHDFGAVAVWSFAAHFPAKTSAVICIARPYHTLELGLEEVLPTINRDIYPLGKYPSGQYDYQLYFEQSLDTAAGWFDKDPKGVIRAIYARGRASEVGHPAITSTVTRDGGWFGGAPAPPANLRHIPTEFLCIDEAMCTELVAAFEKNGFWAPCAWYANHKRNRRYSLEKWENEGCLHMPVLFIGANWDAISEITVSTIADAQGKYCTNLTRKDLDAGHWVALEKADEVNEIMTDWLRGLKLDA